MKKINVKMFVSVILAVMMLLNSVAAYAIESDTPDTASPNWKDKIQPYLLEKMEETDEKIPVWLWFEDIDHDAVEAEVFARTGLTEDNLSVISEDLPEELAIAVAELEDADEEKQEEVRTDFRAYMERTSTERAIEAERVDRYTQALYEVQDEVIEKHNADIFTTLNISDEDVIQSDTGVPCYIVNLNKNDIIRVAENSKVSAMYYYEEVEDVPYYSWTNNLTSVVPATTVSRIRSELNLQGNGIKIGIIDGGRVEANSQIPASRINYLDTSSYDYHATNVACVAAGTNGVAPQATIYSSSGRLENMIGTYSNNNVDVINYSMGDKTRNSNNNYDPSEVKIDYLINLKKKTVLIAGGNNHGVLTAPALSYSAITVGGFYNEGTSSISDDIMYSGSSYDHLSGCYKPDIVADMPAFYDPDTGNGKVGTSYSTPFATGVVALMMEIRPSLKVQPDVVKAILLSSCHRKVTPSSGDPTESMTDGLTNHQGAGAIDPYIAIAITGSGTYGYRVLSSSTSVDTVRFNQPKYNATGMNVTVAWSRISTSQTTAGTLPDLNLSLYNNNTLIKTSAKDNSSTEMVYVTPSSSNFNYTISVNRTNSVGFGVRYAYAYSLSNARYQHSTENTGVKQGVYFLKNAKTNKYMTTSGNNIIQNSFTGNQNQQWFLNGSYVYALSSGSNKKLNLGSSLGSSYYRATTSTTGRDVTYDAISASVSGGSALNGAYAILDSYNDNALCIYNNSSSSGTAVAWSTDTGSQYQQWYLEPVSYRKGDVDFNGTLNSSDVQMIQEYVLNSRTFSDVEKFYADVNGDGSVNNTDAYVLNQIIGGYI